MFTQPQPSAGILELITDLTITSLKGTLCNIKEMWPQDSLQVIDDQQNRIACQQSPYQLQFAAVPRARYCIEPKY